MHRTVSQARRSCFSFGGHKRFLEEQIRVRLSKPSTNESCSRCLEDEDMITEKFELTS